MLLDIPHDAVKASWKGSATLFFRDLGSEKYSENYQGKKDYRMPTMNTAITNADGIGFSILIPLLLEP